MDIKQVIVMRKDLGMRKGKMIAQGCHASMKVFLDRDRLLSEIRHMGTNTTAPTFPYELHVPLTAEMSAWLTGLFTKVVVGCDSETDLRLLLTAAQEAGLPCALIEDSGLTEFHGVKTATCIAIGPAKAEDIDKITGHLTLL